jgi:D-sedoheptulose 7-phosphate isomerase
MSTSFKEYSARLATILNSYEWEEVMPLAQAVERCWCDGNQVFLCGNGGSAGNAVHLANDYLYGIAKETGRGLRAHALSANPAVITSLANDVS